MEMFQTSLFPSRKGEFKPDEFRNAICDTPIVECVKHGLNNGYRRKSETFPAGNM